MFPSNHNQAKAIASLVCPLLRAKSPKVSARWLIGESDPMLDDAASGLRAFGVRKRLFQSKRDYVSNAILYSEPCFEVACPMVELHSTAPNQGIWWGNGAFKDASSTDSAAVDDMLQMIGMAPVGPSALLQISISGIWDRIHPYLEQPPK